MFETPFERGWKTLRNPFRGLPETGEMIVSHVSGRKADIQEIITAGSSAIILAGAPCIGKTSLIRYLVRPTTAKWSWRDELEDLRFYLDPNEVSFTQIDLSQLEGITDADDLLMLFIEQCITALQSSLPWVTGTYSGSGLKGLRNLLRHMTRERPEARYFVVLDSIERLGPDTPSSLQERAIAFLDACGAIHLLVALLGEFSKFGVILSIESRPLSGISNQFIHNSLHVSSDLAHFHTITLQTFTHDDTILFLAQKPESFGATWALQFEAAGGDNIFSDSEQAWLYERAGTHPYLLQQYCFHTFHLKREYAIRKDAWTDLQKSDRDKLIERVNERVSTFLVSTWKRVKEALGVSSPDTVYKFTEFIMQSMEKRASEEIDQETWNNLGQEGYYILKNEGLVRYDLSQPVYYPGSMLLNYLAQKVQEQGKPTTFGTLPQSQSSISQADELIITLPGKQPQPLELTSLEYALMKTLLHYPDKRSEEVLMKSAWGKITSKQVLTQRIFHLRKKLKDVCDGEDMIVNIYGGSYSLKHPDWFHLL